MYQSVVATGQLQLQLLSANIVNDVDTKRLGTVPTAGSQLAAYFGGNITFGASADELTALAVAMDAAKLNPDPLGLGAIVSQYGHRAKLRAGYTRCEGSYFWLT